MRMFLQDGASFVSGGSRVRTRGWPVRSLAAAVTTLPGADIAFAEEAHVATTPVADKNKLTSTDIASLGSAATLEPASNAKAGARPPSVRTATAEVGSTRTESVQTDDPTLKELIIKYDGANVFVAFTLVIGAMFVLTYAFMQFKNRTNVDFSRHLIVMFVIIAAILLLIMGYTETQIAPAYGLLGTVLGYIFGKSAGETETWVAPVTELAGVGSGIGAPTSPPGAGDGGGQAPAKNE